MALFTKCIRHEISAEDGLRISIMSRHTLNDGKTPDPTITVKSFDIRWRIFSPRPSLIGDYYKRGLSWSDFEKRYNEYLESISYYVEELTRMAMRADITLLCTEDTADQCHRRLLAEFCQKIEPDLKVEHR